MVSTGSDEVKEEIRHINNWQSN